MRLGTIAFLAGILLFQQLPTLPDPQWSWLLFLSVPLSFYPRPVALPFWFTNGFLIALIHASATLSSSLPDALEGVDIQVTGVIVSIPEEKDRGLRFEYRILSPAGLPGQVRLNWYRNAPPLHVGEHWQLTLRLKQPHGFMNPGGFDYEGWLFRHGIRATGYVRQDSGNHMLEASDWHYTIDRGRQYLADEIRRALPDSQFQGIFTALAIGVRADIDDEQWQVLLRTGTNHLVAISGLHIGLVAALTFFLVRWLWGYWYWAVVRVSSLHAAALASLAAATVYAALAGFSVPTQRALLMVAVVMTALLLRRQVLPGHLLAVAMLAVLVLDPFAVMDAGFWLSFGAVAAILFGMGGRPAERGFWWRWGRVQWVVAIMLLPMTLLLFQKASLISPLANFIAVPVVSFVVVPLTLAAAISLPLSHWLGSVLLTLADWVFDGLWQLLDFCANVPAAQVSDALSSPWLVIPMIIGTLWLMAPRGTPGRWLGVLWVCVGFGVPAARPAEGEARFTLLDVGQGLSAVVETRRHVMVFDAGPRYSDSFDAGDAVVVPYLRHQGRHRVDQLVISHGDNDHIGGAESILAQTDVAGVSTSVPDLLADHRAQRCLRGQRWQWDGVRFEVLHPSAEGMSGENDNSCVIRVATAGGAVLLTGDIEKPAEEDLVRTMREQLAADILVAPHHGSNTSSSAAFIDAVAPHYVLYPAGYRNRWGFPRPAVRRRYAILSPVELETGIHGALTFRIGPEDLSPPVLYRQQAHRYWHHDVSLNAAFSPG